ncbi:uncharacterized protein LOC121253543 [Juglans microcarpa x Juglans regia]|uniref:uncharacterized protein LOC121253543 n=1 Tax=Juglans microcarpa x Juglans regia TaxID=2249226 RepID=UPI001B7DE3AA|nr:uncharacterized protein LOC121253543 [Juglans microcarpa x Juglans regia]
MHPPAKLSDGSLNAAYDLWLQHDQLVMSALISSLSEPIIAQVVGNTCARDVWLSLESTYASASQARLIQTQFQLASLRKGSDTISTYFRKAKTIADIMAATSCPLPSNEFVPYLLAGLDPDYDALVSSVTTRLDPISTDELFGHLLAHEARMQHHAANLSFFPPQETSTNFSARSSPSNARGRGRDSQSFNRGRNRGGRTSNGYSGNTQFAPSSTFTDSRPICQVCNRLGHIALNCLYRFNQAYTSATPPSAH